MLTQRLLGLARTSRPGSRTLPWLPALLRPLNRHRCETGCRRCAARPAPGLRDPRHAAPIAVPRPQPLASRASGPCAPAVQPTHSARELERPGLWRAEPPATATAHRPGTLANGLEQSALCCATPTAADAARATSRARPTAGCRARWLWLVDRGAHIRPRHPRWCWARQWATQFCGRAWLSFKALSKASTRIGLVT